MATLAKTPCNSSATVFLRSLQIMIVFPVILRNTSDEGTVYVALKPTQIKSAIGNCGTFDPTNPDIRA